VSVNADVPRQLINDRRSLLLSTISTASSAALSFLFFPATSAAAAATSTTNKKCTDLESCREIGERKVEAELKANPVTSLPSGVRYKVLQPGIISADSSSDTVRDGSSIDMIYTLSRSGGLYMYSQGFGYEMIDAAGDGRMQKDLGLDFLRVKVGQHQVPVGIEQALVGMKKGERRRVEVPASVGFETSNWEPAPKTKRGQTALQAYQRVLEGFGSQPAFAAPTVWDIEVSRVRN